MPGAALTGVVDDQTYEGTVAVKLGPLRMSYKGKVTVDEVDEASHSARLTASGKDVKGAGTARASVETRLEPAGDTHTRLKVTSDVQLTGKVASFGRGGAINDVATRLFGQFADCLRATLEAETAAAPEVAAAAGAEPSPPAGTAAAASPPGGVETTAAAASPGGVEGAAGVASPAPSDSAAPSGPGAAGDGTTTAAGGGTTAPPPRAPTPVPPPRAAEALDAGSLVGTVIKGRLAALFQAIAGFFRRLFGRRRPSG
jgi:uncharacterized protein